MKLNFLGVGTASATKIYHTCFTIQNNNEHFLIDSGGGVEILTNLKKMNIDISGINHVFLSHIHIDHCLGMLWFLRKRNWQSHDGLLPLNFYGSKKVLDDFKKVMQVLLKKEFAKTGTLINFHEISDGQTINIIGLDFKFLDTHAKKDEMFGFIASDEHKKVAFVGDEILKNELYDTVRDIDFLMLDALCIGKENKNVLHLRESLEDFLTRTQHSSVKTASLLAKELNIKNLILFHTLDNYKLRKFRYKNEAKKYFNGKVFVPNKFDKINIL